MKWQSSTVFPKFKKNSSVSFYPKITKRCGVAFYITIPHRTKSHHHTNEKIPPLYGRDSPEQNAERRINKGKSWLKIFLYHYKGIETADRMSYN